MWNMVTHQGEISILLGLDISPKEERTIFSLGPSQEKSLPLKRLSLSQLLKLVIF